MSNNTFDGDYSHLLGSCPLGSERRKWILSLGSGYHCATRTVSKWIINIFYPLFVRRRVYRSDSPVVWWDSLRVSKLYLDYKTETIYHWETRRDPLEPWGTEQRGYCRPEQSFNSLCNGSLKWPTSKPTPLFGCKARCATSISREPQIYTCAYSTETRNWERNPASRRTRNTHTSRQEFHSRVLPNLALKAHGCYSVWKIVQQLRWRMSVWWTIVDA
jgi:hypothetical protein